jgi:hypothetical protein
MATQPSFVATRPAEPNEWGALTEPSAARATVAAGVLAALALSAASLIVSSLRGNGGLYLIAVVCLGALWWCGAGWGKRLLRSATARRLRAGEEPRWRSLVSGLARDLRIETPDLWVIPAAGPNALVCYAGTRPAVAVTGGMVESFTRTELEAVAAHCLAKEVALGPWWASWLSLASLRGPPSGGVDLTAVALTRYPPALASALRKGEPRGGWARHLWFVGSRVTPSAERRASALLDL